VELDGVDDSLSLPPIRGAMAFSLWVKIASVQPSAVRYLLDARGSSNPNGVFASTTVGGDVVGLYLDGGAQPVQWRRLANLTDLWVHVHLELRRPTDRVTFLMGRFDGTSCLAGRVSELFVWARALSTAEVAQLAHGDTFAFTPGGGLVSLYPLEEPMRAGVDAWAATSATAVDVLLNSDPVVIRGGVR
jgi:hypothetical protein